LNGKKVVVVEMFCCLNISGKGDFDPLISQAIQDEMLFILLLSYAALVGSKLCERS